MIGLRLVYFDVKENNYKYSESIVKKNNLKNGVLNYYRILKGQIQRNCFTPLKKI